MSKHSSKVSGASEVRMSRMKSSLSSMVTRPPSDDEPALAADEPEELDEDEELEDEEDDDELEEDDDELEPCGQM